MTIKFSPEEVDRILREYAEKHILAKPALAPVPEKKTINLVKTVKEEKKENGKVKVHFDENNSGGSYWLDDSHYEALREAGWNVEGYKSATKEFASLEEGIKEWEKVTGENSEEQGCSCCGRPYQFWED